MQVHIKVWLRSRHKDGTEGYHNCEKCGRNNGVDVHHINGRKGEHANSEYNLIMMCRECHTYVHANNTLDMKEELELIVETTLG